MRASKTRPAPDLGSYSAPRVVYSDDKEAWASIRSWQRKGLVSVRPINKTMATVELTQKGWQAVITPAV